MQKGLCHQRIGSFLGWLFLVSHLYKERIIVGQVHYLVAHQQLLIQDWNSLNLHK